MASCIKRPAKSSNHTSPRSKSSNFCHKKLIITLLQIFGLKITAVALSCSKMTFSARKPHPRVIFVHVKILYEHQMCFLSLYQRGKNFYLRSHLNKYELHTTWTKRCVHCFRNYFCMLYNYARIVQSALIMAKSKQYFAKRSLSQMSIRSVFYLRSFSDPQNEWWPFNTSQCALTDTHNLLTKIAIFWKQFVGCRLHKAKRKESGTCNIYLYYHLGS